MLYYTFRLSTVAAKSAIEAAYSVFTNEQSYPPEARKAACERVCLILLHSCSEQTLRDFFVDHIREIADVIEANLSKVVCVCVCVRERERERERERGREEERALYAMTS